MTNQFIAHSDTPRTFASKKGATAAIKRDMQKHDEAHGDVLLETGFEVLPSGDAFGVVIFCDLTATTAQKLVGPELHGYVIEPQLKDEPVRTPVNVRDGKPAHKDDYPATKTSRRKGQISVEPTAPLIHCRVGSKQQAIIDMLAREQGATLDDLRAVCIKKDGVTAWDDNSIRSALYYDLKDKGYGTRTEFAGDVPSYFLVLPEGIDAPLEAKATKS
tara:strand:+ start:3959 stop:4609 length:651 start_codon:yes stop_codon:yes gene_type:complete